MQICDFPKCKKVVIGKFCDAHLDPDAEVVEPFAKFFLPGQNPDRVEGPANTITIPEGTYTIPKKEKKETVMAKPAGKCQTKYCREESIGLSPYCEKHPDGIGTKVEKKKPGRPARVKAETLPALRPTKQAMALFKPTDGGESFSLDGNAYQVLGNAIEELKLDLAAMERTQQVLGRMI